MTCAINWDLIRLIKAIQYMRAIFGKEMLTLTVLTTPRLKTHALLLFLLIQSVTVFKPADYFNFY